MWGIVENEDGTRHAALLETPNGYELTAQMSLEIAAALAQQTPRAGFWTPAGYLCPELIQRIPGCQIKDVPAGDITELIAQ